jgi:fructokinase
MSEPLAVVAGEALIDLVPGPNGTLAWHPGGGPFNAARTVARLGQRVRFLGGVSTDRYGVTLLAALENDGVEIESVLRTDAPTTLAIAEPLLGTTRYRFYHDGTSAVDVDPDDVRGRMPPEASTLLIGTLGLVFEPMATSLEALLAGLTESTTVVVDPNCRPGAVADVPAYLARLERVLARADVVKLSEEDLRWLRPGRSLEQAVATLLAGGPACAIVTAGADGAVVVMREGPIVRVPAAPARVIDTIGAGDAFVGALIAWWSAHGLGRADWSDASAVVDAAQFAAYVAARTCERPGADPPDHRELPDELRLSPVRPAG